MQFILTKYPISFIQKIPELTQDNSDIKFVSSEKGTINFSGGCGTDQLIASVGSNQITLKALSDGKYKNCSLTVTDDSGIQGDPYRS